MPVTAGRNHFMLLYGSQTGQAKAIAEEIAERAETENFHVDIFCLGQTEKKFYLERETCVVIVTSTTGDGEPPDTALKFVRRLRKKTLSENYLEQLNFTLLGLGDSNYTNFCNCGKNLDKRLLELGATHFYPPGWADDAVGLEVVVEPWIDGLWAALKNFLNKDTKMDTGKLDQTSELDINKSVIDDKDPETGVNGYCENSETGNIQTTRNEAKDIQSAENLATGCSSVGGKAADYTIADQTNSSVEQTGTSINQTSTFVKQTGLSVEKTFAPVKQKDLRSNLSDLSEVNCDSGKMSSTSNFEIKSSVPETGEDSIRKSLPPLSESTLAIPALSPAYLTIEYSEDVVGKILPGQHLQNGCEFPSSASPVSMATVVSIRTLTSPAAVKKAMAVTLDVSETGLKYEPGDSFSIICPNHSDEVEALLERVGVLDKADCPYTLEVLTDTKKRNASVPGYVPDTDSLRQIFTTCLDICEPPKKALLRVLVEYTTDQSQKRRLQELCSKQGASDYTKFIREPALSILDILHHFPSCKPPVERLIEHLPRLQPRPYSASSSPLASPGQVEAVFNVVEIPATDGRTHHRKGVCTGWLEKLMVMNEQLTEEDLERKMEKLTVSQEIKVPIFARTNQHFRLPDDVTTPLILIGPGTGVAPFIGFLEQRAVQRESNCGSLFGDVWLFYGCRHKERDFLFRDRLEFHQTNSTLAKLLVSFSRDSQLEGSPRYVQDNIRAHGKELLKLLEEENAIVYVCGDAKNMAKDVNEAFTEIYVREKGISADEARKLLMKLRLVKQYKEDVWT